MLNCTYRCKQSLLHIADKSMVQVNLSRSHGGLVFHTCTHSWSRIVSHRLTKLPPPKTTFVNRSLSIFYRKHLSIKAFFPYNRLVDLLPPCVTIKHACKSDTITCLLQRVVSVSLYSVLLLRDVVDCRISVVVVELSSLLWNKQCK